MDDNVELLDIVQAALGTFDHRQSYAPGMFEPLKPLFQRLGYESVAVYLADDYPDRMRLASGYGGEELFPNYVALARRPSLFEELLERLDGARGILAERLFSHGRELGALVAVSPEARKKNARDAFRILAKSLSIMAYLERVRTNGCRERVERDIFFAQSLTNRLLIREAPKVKDLRLGFEFMRSLEAGGDFFDLIPVEGGLLGFIGRCSGKGLRTVLEVCHIMRTTHRACQTHASLPEVMRLVNALLVGENRRAHQASLCLFHVDTGKRRLRLATAGRLGMLLCGDGIANISAPGATFLGMVSDPDFQEDRYDFGPGQSLFCVTEGIYNTQNCLETRPEPRWFQRALETTLKKKRKVPLANALFANLENAGDHGARPADSLLAVSVEFTGK